MKTVKSIKRKSAGFTLIEALMAAMLIGLAIAALASSSGAFTMYNAAGLDLSTSEFLIDEIRELTASVKFSDLGTLYNGRVYNPPRDSFSQPMTDFAAYTQTINVAYVTAANLATVSVGATDFRRITVTISKSGQTITSTSWIRAQY
jgi:type II secretory pathway pseudopilin PulG